MEILLSPAWSPCLPSCKITSEGFNCKIDGRALLDMPIIYWSPSKIKVSEQINLSRIESYVEQQTQVKVQEQCVCTDSNKRAHTLQMAVSPSLETISGMNLIQALMINQSLSKNGRK